MSKVKEKVYEVLRNEIGSAVELQDKTVVLNVSGIDVNVQRDLIMRLEEEFDIEIPETEAEKLFTVGDLVTFITTKVKK